MTEKGLIYLVCLLLVSLCASGFALLECSKLLHSVAQYKHSVDILEDLYDSTRNTVDNVLAETSKTMNHVDKMIDSCEKIMEFDREIIEDHNKLKNDISMLQIRLEDTYDNS